MALGKAATASKVFSSVSLLHSYAHCTFCVMAALMIAHPPCPIQPFCYEDGASYGWSGDTPMSLVESSSIRRVAPACWGERRRQMRAW